MYLVYVTFQMGLYRQLFAGCCVMLPTLTYVQYYSTDKDTALLYLGIISATLGVISYGSPLAATVSITIFLIYYYFVSNVLHFFLIILC